MLKRILRWLIPIVMTAGFCLQPMLYAETTAVFHNGSHVELMIHGGITNGQDEINFRSNTSSVDLESVKITISTPGGDVPEMLGMIHHIEDLKARGVHVTTEVTGRALSAGAFLWLMGDERIVHKTSKLMFHKAAYQNAYGDVDCKTLFEGACWQLELDNQWAYDLIRSLVSEKITNFLFNDKNVYITGQAAFDLGLATEVK